MKVIYVISILIIYLEMFYKAIVLKSGSAIDILYTILFSAQIILIINLICNLFKEKISKIILMIVSTIITIWFGTQAVFFNLFSVPLSFSTLGLAGGALGYVDVVIEIIVKNTLIILACLLPLILLFVFNKKIKFEQYNKKTILIFLAIILSITGLKVGAIHIDKNDIYSAYNLCYKMDAQEQNIKKFGVLTSTIIDLKRTTFGFNEKLVIEASTNIGSEKTEAKTEYNKVDLKLEEKTDNTTDKTLKSI